jgi:hypothetical protein
MYVLLCYFWIIYFIWEPIYGWVLRRAYLQPTRVQIPDLTLWCLIKKIFFSGRRCFRRLRDACDDFVNLKTRQIKFLWLGLSNVLIRVGCVCPRSYGWVYVRMCECLHLYCVSNKDNILYFCWNTLFLGYIWYFLFKHYLKYSTLLAWYCVYIIWRRPRLFLLARYFKHWSGEIIFILRETFAFHWTGIQHIG